jgi:hypothetical protein
MRILLFIYESATNALQTLFGSILNLHASIVSVNAVHASILSL